MLFQNLYCPNITWKGTSDATFYFYLFVIYLLFRLSDQTILSSRTDTMEESQDKHVEFNHIDLFRVCVEKQTFLQSRIPIVMGHLGCYHYAVGTNLYNDPGVYDCPDTSRRVPSINNTNKLLAKMTYYLSESNQLLKCSVYIFNSYTHHLKQQIQFPNIRVVSVTSCLGYIAPNMLKLNADKTLVILFTVQYFHYVTGTVLRIKANAD